MSDTAARVDITLYDNETLYQEFEYLIDGEAIDLSGSDIYAQARDNGPGGSVVLDLSIGSGITLKDQTTDTGKFFIHADEVAVGALPVDQHIPYDIVLVQPDRRKRIVVGSVRVNKGITVVP